MDAKIKALTSKVHVLWMVIPRIDKVYKVSCCCDACRSEPTVMVSIFEELLHTDCRNSLTICFVLASMASCHMAYVPK